MISYDYTFRVVTRQPQDCVDGGINDDDDDMGDGIDYLCEPSLSSFLCLQSSVADDMEDGKGLLTFSCEISQRIPGIQDAASQQTEDAAISTSSSSLNLEEKAKDSITTQHQPSFVSCSKNKLNLVAYTHRSKFRGLCFSLLVA